MQCYLLLRNNRESGPFTFEEIVAQALTPTDLIWIEGLSSSWKNPTELAALNRFVADDANEKKDADQEQGFDTSKIIFVAFPSQQKLHNQLPKSSCNLEEPVLETRPPQPLEHLDVNHKAFNRDMLFRLSKTFSKPHAVWLAGLFTGTLLSAVLIKKIVYDLDDKAQEIVAAVQPTQDRDHLESGILYQNALTTEVVPVDTISLKPVKKVLEKANLKMLVRVEANDYQVGLTGGIKNLRLLVRNKSGFALDKVKIDLDYLKPNGSIIKTEHLLVRSVPAKSSRSLNVSSWNRAAKVVCRITGIQSKQNEPGLVNL